MWLMAEEPTRSCKLPQRPCIWQPVQSDCTPQSTVQRQPSMMYVPRLSTRTTRLKLTSRPPCVLKAAAIASATRCPDACIGKVTISSNTVTGSQCQERCARWEG
jgi:hypothetical protein